MSAIRSERGVMVPLRQLVPLPNTTITVDIGRELSKRAVDAAVRKMARSFFSRRSIRMWRRQTWRRFIRSAFALR